MQKKKQLFTLLAIACSLWSNAQSGREKIHLIHAMNLMGDGKSLTLVEAPIANCTFMNGIYTGAAPSAITYTIDKSKPEISMRSIWLK